MRDRCVGASVVQILTRDALLLYVHSVLLDANTIGERYQLTSAASIV